ncbi:hypothetical protein STAFG_0733 [Streptomyces afghaniensis 772]|uniref:Uncharacterized protein n=1 Tax=Streptomyces afghaniensis 772 TaxID=1283301 RepID=S4MYM0_9ACTN|nr:hypothetical protein STAFG_0733 [Streptomyces afghaniensis 772]
MFERKSWTGFMTGVVRRILRFHAHDHLWEAPRLLDSAVDW